jgi:hypothetical protein
VANFSPAGNYSGQYATNVVTPTKGQDNDATLRWTSFDGTTWSPVALLSEHESSHGPAVAVFSAFGGPDTLYCVHKGNTDTNLRYTTWATDTVIPNCVTGGAAQGLAVYQDKLVGAYVDNTSEGQLQFTSYDGMSWAAAAQIGAQAGAGPAMATYQNKLFCVHRSRSDARLCVTTFDGTAWSTDTPIPIPNCQTAVIPALAVYRDKLYCAHHGNDGYVWCTIFDGTSWSEEKRISDGVTASGPALAAYQDKLYCAYRGGGDYVRYLSYDGTAWSASAKIPDAPTTKNPALAVHHNRLYCVHRK